MSLKILFVDDEPFNTDMYMEYFKTFDFLDVSEVHTPQAAIDHIEHNKPDLVFLDVSLGEQQQLNGVDVLKAVHKTTPSSKIVMVSAYGHFKPEAMANGAYEYVMKPCRPKMLLDIAKRLES